MSDEAKAKFLHDLNALCRKHGLVIDWEQARLCPDDGRLYLAMSDGRMVCAFPCATD